MCGHVGEVLSCTNSSGKAIYIKLEGCKFKFTIFLLNFAVSNEMGTTFDCIAKGFSRHKLISIKTSI